MRIASALGDQTGHGPSSYGAGRLYQHLKVVAICKPPHDLTDVIARQGLQRHPLVFSGNCFHKNWILSYRRLQLQFNSSGTFQPRPSLKTWDSEMTGRGGSRFLGGAVLCYCPSTEATLSECSEICQAWGGEMARRVLLIHVIL